LLREKKLERGVKGGRKRGGKEKKLPDPLPLVLMQAPGKREGCKHKTGGEKGEKGEGIKKEMKKEKKKKRGKGRRKEKRGRTLAV